MRPPVVRRRPVSGIACPEAFFSEIERTIVEHEILVSRMKLRDTALDLPTLIERGQYEIAKRNF